MPRPLQRPSLRRNTFDISVDGVSGGFVRRVYVKTNENRVSARSFEGASVTPIIVRFEGASLRTASGGTGTSKVIRSYF